MSTADEIRARVKKADEARIEHRAERAATVAEAHSRRASLLAQLAQVDTDLDKSVRAALEVMTLGELVEFADVPRADVRGKTPVRAAAVKARSPKTRRRATTKTATPADDVPPAATPA